MAFVSYKMFLFLIKLRYACFYCLAEGKSEDTYKDDGGSRWNIELIADEKPDEAVEPANDDAVEDEPPVTEGEDAGCHLWNGEQTDGKDYTHHLKGGDDGHGDECHHHVFYQGDGKMLRKCKGAVECHTLDGAQK